LPYPSYSPDLAPFNFFFFPHLIESYVGVEFSAEEIVTATREAARDLPANILAVFAAVIPTLADLHSGQLLLF
jgi:hypothetical protein